MIRSIQVSNERMNSSSPATSSSMATAPIIDETNPQNNANDQQKSPTGYDDADSLLHRSMCTADHVTRCAAESLMAQPRNSQRRTVRHQTRCTVRPVVCRSRITRCNACEKTANVDCIFSKNSRYRYVGRRSYSKPQNTDRPLFRGRIRETRHNCRLTTA